MGCTGRDYGTVDCESKSLWPKKKEKAKVKKEIRLTDD